jgi:hypothetical protein
MHRLCCCQAASSDLAEKNASLQALVQNYESKNQELVAKLEGVTAAKEAAQVAAEQASTNAAELEARVAEQEAINVEFKATFDETVAQLEEALAAKADLETELEAARVSALAAGECCACACTLYLCTACFPTP